MISENLIAFLFATLLLCVLPFFDYETSLTLMLLICLVGFFTLGDFYRIMIAIGFISGFLGDASLQIYTSIIEGKERNEALRDYFNSVGRFNALLMGGTLTVGMLVHTISFATLVGIKNTPLVIFIGAIVGALWGVLAEPSKGGEPMNKFYLESTSGYLENRLWDATTIPFVFLVLLVYNFICGDNVSFIKT